MELKVDENARFLLRQSDNGVVKLYFGITDFDKKMKHGEIITPTDKELDTMIESAKCVVQLDRISLINITKILLRAATKDEFFEILKDWWDV